MSFHISIPLKHPTVSTTSNGSTINSTNSTNKSTTIASSTLSNPFTSENEMTSCKMTLRTIDSQTTSPCSYICLFQFERVICPQYIINIGFIINKMNLSSVSETSSQSAIIESLKHAKQGDEVNLFTFPFGSSSVDTSTTSHSVLKNNLFKPKYKIIYKRMIPFETNIYEEIRDEYGNMKNVSLSVIVDKQSVSLSVNGSIIYVLDSLNDSEYTKMKHKFQDPPSSSSSSGSSSTASPIVFKSAMLYVH